MKDRRFDISMFERYLAPLHPDAWRILPWFALATLLLFWLWTPLGWVGVAITIWCATLFREAERMPPLHPVAVVSPIDGRVIEVGSAPPPAELGLEAGELRCVSIALGPWESHIVRAPAEGALVNLVRLISGDGGERLAARIDSEAGAVGLVASAEGLGRRVRLDAAPGTGLKRGDRFGMVLFAGHVEIYLPAGSEPAVESGQRMVAGETVLTTGLTGLSASRS